MKARPTTDRAREGLFNIIENNFNIPDLHVLDLFAGTGSISFEFVSRGAAGIVLVEKEMMLYRFIRDTIRSLGMENIEVRHGDAIKFLNTANRTFDIVFADPPFRSGYFAKLPGLVINSGIVEPDGWFILEHPAPFSYTENPNFFREIKYGHIHFSIFRKGV